MRKLELRTFQNLERFFRKTKREKQCLEWRSNSDKDGYGKFWTADQGQVKAHRWIWAFFCGTIPVGKFICHTCGNARCVNLEHLYLGDIFTNNRDTVKDGNHVSARKTHCPKGHAYAGENLRITHTDGGRQRKCKACARVNCKKYYYAKKKQA